MEEGWEGGRESVELAAWKMGTWHPPVMDRKIAALGFISTAGGDPPGTGMGKALLGFLLPGMTGWLPVGSHILSLWGCLGESGVCFFLTP